MLKPRPSFFIAIGLLIFFITLFAFSTRNQESAPVIPATINRDCAPWDGAAFTVSIPEAMGAFIDIFIWQSPALILPTTFSFPDQKGNVGNAIYRPALGTPEQLIGTVFFTRVDESHPVEGAFNFTTESGREFKGRFNATWEEHRALCG